MSTLGSAVRASASALHAERMRIEVAVSNLANAESTRGPDGRPLPLGAGTRVGPARGAPATATGSPAGPS